MLKTLFIGCAGAGSNVVEVLKNGLPDYSFCNYVTVDTSSANTKKDIEFVHFTKDSLKNELLNGSGGVRGTNLEDIKKASAKFIKENSKAAISQLGAKNDYVTKYLQDRYVAAKVRSVIESKADILTKVKEAQASYAKSSKEQDTRNAVIEQMKKKCKVKFPKDLVNERIKEYEDRYVDTYVGKKSKTTLKSYLKKTYNTTVKAFEKDVKKNIEDNLKTELIFEAVAKKENIKLDEKDFKSYVKNLMTQNNVEKEDDLYKLFAPNAAGGKQYLEKMYTANKSVDYVVKKAKVTIKPAEAAKTAQ